MSAKPKSEICDRCEVIRNKLRCSICKHATEEWIFSDDGACIVGGIDMFKSKDGLLTMPRHQGMSLVNQTYNELKAILKLGGEENEYDN